MHTKLKTHPGSKVMQGSLGSQPEVNLLRNVCTVGIKDHIEDHLGGSEVALCRTALCLPYIMGILNVVLLILYILYILYTPSTINMFATWRCCRSDDEFNP